MGRIAIAVYRPKKGKEARLLDLVKNHLPILRKESLVTDRSPIIARASDNSIIEIFEWKSSEAIAAAHHNPEVAKLWASFSEVCDYAAPVSVKEFNNMFSEFEPIN